MPSAFSFLIRGGNLPSSLRVARHPPGTLNRGRKTLVNAGVNLEWPLHA